MKPISRLYFLLVVVIMLSSCVPTGSMLTPIWTETQTPSPIFMPPTFTLTPQRTQAATLKPPATLDPKQAEEAISKLLGEQMTCQAPCFWGITPGKSTLDEARNIFAHLGLPIWHNILGNRELYGVDYKFDSGLSISPILTIQNNVVKNLRVGINPEKRQAGVPREWLAYSPETLINHYGTPSRVEFFVDRGAPSIGYDMDIYFDSVDLIVQYGGYDITFETTSFRVCPLTDQFDFVSVWMGQDPQSPPRDAVPLEEATSMTMEEFANLMKENPENACINLKEEVFH